MAVQNLEDWEVRWNSRTLPVQKHLPQLRGIQLPGLSPSLDFACKHLWTFLEKLLTTVFTKVLCSVFCYVAGLPQTQKKANCLNLLMGIKHPTWRTVAPPPPRVVTTSLYVPWLGWFHRAGTCENILKFRGLGLPLTTQVLTVHLTMADRNLSLGKVRWYLLGMPPSLSLGLLRILEAAWPGLLLFA